MHDPANAICLISLVDFLIHRVVLQNHKSPGDRPNRADVSRETFLRKLRRPRFSARRRITESGRQRST
jgi:hypothetical protein